jgi:alpha-tubulin suppressor-like RCC1 family protein/predicted membrane-bound spermidine synthase/tetratricopeptide (TPR) repeat protein
VLLALFLSGLAGLMHEVVWAKLLANLTGSTAKAHAVVLSVFMGGLAIGAVLFGRRSDRRARPLLVYVVLEVAIGIYCLLLPWLTKGAGAVYEAAAAATFEQAGLKLVLRLILSLAVVMLPAILMGGTLPVLARYLVQEVAQTRKAVASLYALNNIGAVLGSGAAGFWLLPEFGIYGALAAASAMNFLAAAIVWVANARTTYASEPRAQASVPELFSYTPSQFRLTLWALALSGFAAMGYEIVFLRIIALGFGSSTYSFTVMLMCFITGIGIGSWIVSVARIERPLWWLAASQLAVIVALIATTPLIERLPYFISSFRTTLIDWPADPGAIEPRGERNGGFPVFLAAQAAYCFAMLLLPTICIGFGFPLVSQIQARSVATIGGTVGNTYAWNTVGNVLGVVITSLALMPGLGMEGALHANLALNAIAALLLLSAAAEASLVARGAAFGATAAALALYGLAWTGWTQTIKRSEGHLRLREGPPVAHRYVALSAGRFHSLGLGEDGSLIAFGSNAQQQLRPPPDPAARFVEVAAGDEFSVARRPDGSLQAWGSNRQWQGQVPAGTDFVEVAAGAAHAVARRADGSLVAWGANDAAQLDVPDSDGATFVEIAAGGAHSLARRADGTVVGWGDDSRGQLAVPALPEGTTYVEIDCGRAFSVALRSDGAVVAWGDDSAGVTRVPELPPATTYLEIAAGDLHALARRSDGAVIAWGDDHAGQCRVPLLPPGVAWAAVSAGGAHSLGLRSDGVVFAWGRNDEGQCDAPKMPPPADELLLARHPATSFGWWKRQYVRDPGLMADGWDEFYLGEDADTNVMGVRRERLAAIYINSKGDASTGPLDMITFLLSGHIPMFFLPDPRDIMVIGHGSGVTTGAISQYPSVERIDVVEISKAVMQADRLFENFNHHVLKDPRTHVYLDDARTFLRTVPRKYDMIVSQPSNPWIAGIGSLFTVDFFEDCRDRLKPGGIMLVWFHHYEQSDETIQLIVRTINEVFPHVEAFLSFQSDVIALATMEPIEADFARMESRFDLPAVRQDLARVGVYNLATMLAYHGMDGPHFRALSGAGPLNTDDHQILEYEGARNMFAGRIARLLERASGFSERPDGRTDSLLDRYIAWREAQGEPVHKLEMEIARSSVDNIYQGNDDHRIPATIRLRAEATPDDGATAAPSSPARGLRVPVGEMGFSEAFNWSQYVIALEGKEAAIPYVQRALELEPANAGAAMRLAELYKDTNRSALAKQELERVIAAGSRRTDPQLALARTYLQQGREADARAMLQELVEYEDNGVALMLLGELHGRSAMERERVGDREGRETALRTAEDYFLRAILRDPKLHLWPASVNYTQILRMRALEKPVDSPERRELLERARSELDYALFHNPGVKDLLDRRAEVEVLLALSNQI